MTQPLKLSSKLATVLRRSSRLSFLYSSKLKREESSTIIPPNMNTPITELLCNRSAPTMGAKRRVRPFIKIMIPM